MAYFDATADVSELEAYLGELAERGTNLTPIMAVIADDLVAAVNDRYESEGDGEWPPHAESTLRKRRGGGRGAKLLQDTGILAGSTAADYGADFAEAFSGVDYLKYHLEGGPIIPKRNPFELRDEVYDEASQTLINYIVEGAGA